MLKFLFRIIILSVAGLAVLWGYWSPQQRAEIISRVQQAILGNVNTVAPQAGLEPDKVLQTQTAEAGIPHTEKAINGLQQLIEGYIKQDYSHICGRTKTQAVKSVNQPSIYKWTDKNGKVNFSDKAVQGASNVGDQYASRAQYFKLNLKYSDNKPRAFYKDRITADTYKIYELLSRQLAVEDLRQVNLNVSLFSTADSFEQYRQQVAPGLQTSSGFYTSKNNEAAILIRRNAQHTMPVVRHEASHVIMSGLYGPTPTWFNEGLAEYFEQLKIRTMAAHISPNMYWFKHLKSLKKTGLLPSLNDYLSLNGHSWREQDQTTMYAMGWGLIYFFMSDHSGREQLSEFMQSLSDHLCMPFSTINHFQEQYPGGLYNLQLKFDNWLSQDRLAAHNY